MATFTITWELSDLQQLLASGLARRKGVDIITALNGIYADEVQKAWITYAAANRQNAFKVCMTLRRDEKTAIATGGADNIELQLSHIISFLMACDLYNLDTAKNASAVGWTGCSAMSALKSPCVKDQVPKGKLQKMRERFASILQGLSLGDGEYDKTLKDQIQHYVSEALSSEEHLSAQFEECRAKLLDKCDDTSCQLDMFWTLHDCLKQSMENLKNRKLVEFFANEMRNLSLNEEAAGESKVKATRPIDLKKADQFLSGTGEITSLAKTNESLSEALSKAKAFVREQPKSFQGRMALAFVCDKLEDYSHAFEEYSAAIDLDPESEKAQKGAVWAITKHIYSLLNHRNVPKGDYMPPLLADAMRVFGDSPSGKEEKECGNTNIIMHGMELIGKLSQLQKPSVAYSQYLRAFTKILKYKKEKDKSGIGQCAAQAYLDFVRKWDVGYFLEEDYAPFAPKDNSKKKFSSLAEMVVGAVCNCAILRAEKGLLNSDGITADWVFQTIEWGIERFPHQIWFPYYYGKLLTFENDKKGARKRLIPIARRKASEFWAWKAVADTFDDDDENRLICLCRAAQCRANDEAQKIGIHEALAKSFIAKAMLPEARRELLIISDIAKEKGWKGTGKRANDIFVEAVKSGTPILLAEPTKDNHRLYAEYASKANEIILGDDSSRIEGILSDINAQRGFSKFTIGDNGETCSVDWKRIPDIADMPLGTICDLWLVCGSKNGHFHVIRAKATQTGELPPFSKTFTGILKRLPGRAYGFVDNIFVPPSVVGNWGNSSQVTGLAVKSYDKLKECVGWKALKLEAVK